jgi:hypothetical protein
VGFFTVASMGRGFDVCPPGWGADALAARLAFLNELEKKPAAASKPMPTKSGNGERGLGDDEEVANGMRLSKFLIMH